MLGKIKTFNKGKGYGFITAGEGQDIFFHYSELIMEGFKTIEPGTEVEFEQIETERGLQAKKVVRVQPKSE